MEKMRQMAKKKQEESKKSTGYVMMHELLSKAESDREERRRLIHTQLKPGEHSFVYFRRHSSGFSEYYQVVGEDQ